MKKLKQILNVTIVTSLVFIPMNAFALTKKETIYTNLDYNGVPTKTTVSNHLYIDSKEDIVDNTELEDILNINGKEKFKLTDNNLVWENSGKDIFYEGTTNKESLISIKAKYYLNDKETNVKDMLGKKGKVKIELTFTNNSYLEEKNIYTPVVATIGTIINSKQNSNVEISTGKVLDTGTKNIIVGIVAPGLYESTNLEELKDLNEVTITYDTTKFSLNNIYIIATPKLLSESDFDVFNKIDNLSSSINIIQDSMNKLESGANELENGSITLSNGTSELKNGLNNVLGALNKLENGSITLDNGLKEIVNELNNASNMLQNNDINSSILQLEALKQQNTLAINNLKATNLNLETNYNTYQLASFTSETDLINYFTSQGLDSNSINNLVTLKKTYEANSNLVILLEANNTAINQTINSLSTLTSEVNNLINELNYALSELENGANSLGNGLGELKVGVDKLYNGSISLDEGANKLSNGTTTLKNGISKLNKDGINVIYNYSNKFKSYSDKAKEMVELSKEYNGYTSNNAENTIFIYKMQSIK